MEGHETLQSNNLETSRGKDCLREQMPEMRGPGGRNPSLESSLRTLDGDNGCHRVEW